MSKFFKHTSEAIYFFIWVLCIVGAFINIGRYYIDDIIRLSKEDFFGLCWMSLFALASIYQQFLIYLDIHDFENDDEKSHAVYGRWIDKGFEKVLRYSIFIFLIFYVGKITSTLEFIFPESKTIDDYSFWDNLIKEDGIYHKFIFIGGVTLVFFCQFLWNLFAFFYSNEEKKYDEDRLTFINPRIVFFGLSTLLAFFYWSSLLFSLDSFKEISKVLIGFYLFFSILTLMYRYPTFWTTYHTRIRIQISKFNFNVLQK